MPDQVLGWDVPEFLDLEDSSETGGVGDGKPARGLPLGGVPRSCAAEVEVEIKRYRYRGVAALR